jgi:hypothetical protein
MKLVELPARSSHECLNSLARNAGWRQRLQPTVTDAEGAVEFAPINLLQAIVQVRSAVANSRTFPSILRGIEVV